MEVSTQKTSLPENPVVRRPRPVKTVADFWKVDNEKSCGLVIFRTLKKTFNALYTSEFILNLYLKSHYMKSIDH